MDVQQQVDQLRAQLRIWDRQRRREARQSAGPVLAPIPVDAGPVDAGPVDAGPVDAGPIDAGPVDAGPIDGRDDCLGSEREVSSTGCGALDRLLPRAGFGRGSLVEFVGEPGSGAAVLAWIAAREAGRRGRPIVIVDHQHRFYPPAASAWGGDLGQTLVVQPANLGETLWALDQILRCAAVAAAWASLESLDGRWFRRLQLAAEKGGTLGLLLRSSGMGRHRAGTRSPPHDASWADVRLEVIPVPGAVWPAAGPPEARRSDICVSPCLTSDIYVSPCWRIEVRVARCRHGRPGGKVVLELDEVTGEMREASGHETHSLSLVPALADPAMPGGQPPTGPTTADPVRHR